MKWDNVVPCIIQHKEMVLKGFPCDTALTWELLQYYFEGDLISLTQLVLQSTGIAINLTVWKEIQRKSLTVKSIKVVPHTCLFITHIFQYTLSH